MELAVGASESAMRSLLGKLGSLLAQEYTLISGVLAQEYPRHRSRCHPR
jgi:disease resistance protein RPM1